MKIINTISAILILLFGLIVPAYAYLDPGTGSLIIQGLIASIVFGLATMRMWWYRVKIFFTGDKQKKTDDVDTDED